MRHAIITRCYGPLLALACLMTTAGCEEGGDKFDGLSRYQEQIEDGAGGWTFTAHESVVGVEVRYLAHSQSMTNYAQNRVVVSLSVNGQSKGARSDGYDSQTTLGSLDGFWHSAAFPGVSLQKGDQVTVVLSVEAGDYRNYVSEVQVLALR